MTLAATVQPLALSQTTSCPAKQYVMIMFSVHILGWRRSFESSRKRKRLKGFGMSDGISSAATVNGLKNMINLDKII